MGASHTRGRGITLAPLHILIALSLAAAAIVALQARPAAAEPPSDEKCITYEFHYLDEDSDSGEKCTTGNVGSIINVTRDSDGIHVKKLHLSCSDPFDIEVYEDGELIGFTSDGNSDLDGHVIAIAPGTEDDPVPWFSISKSWADDCETSFTPTFSLAIDKRISVDGGATWLDADDPDSADTPEVAAGDTVDYHITVTNTGSGDLTDVVVDDNVYDDCDTTIASLPVTDPEWTCTFTTTAGETDLENTATATAGDLSDADDANYTVRQPEPVYGLDTVKHVSVDGGGTWLSGESEDDDGGTATAGVPATDEGDPVHFRITVTSTDDPLSSVALTDSVYDFGQVTLDETSDCAAEDVDGSGDLQIGALSGSWTCVFSVAAGEPGTVTNTATSSSLDEPADPASDTAAFSVNEPPPPAEPAISLVKTADAQTARVGDVVTYTYEVTNTGDVTLDLLTLDDDQLGAVTLAATTLAAGDQTTGTATHTVTEDDLPGPIVNVATVTGVAPDETQVSAQDDESVELVTDPSIQVVKTPDTSGAEVGEVITYTYDVTNTGDVTLTGVTAVDDQLGAVTLAATTLEPGASTTGTLSYTAVEDDLPGPIVNVVVATGTPPVGADVTDDDDALVSLSSNPAIALVKTADVDENAEGIKVVEYAPNDGDDETVGYTYLVTNTGDVTLTDLSLVDDVLGDITLDVTSLAPGESTTASGTHVITQANADNGEILNTAVVTGVGPDGTSVDAQDDESVFVQTVLPLVVDRPDEPEPAPEPEPEPEPAPEEEVEPAELPRTGLDSDVLAVLAFALVGLGALLLQAPSALARPAGRRRRERSPLDAAVDGVWTARG